MFGWSAPVHPTMPGPGCFPAEQWFALEAERSRDPLHADGWLETACRLVLVLLGEARQASCLRLQPSRCASWTGKGLTAHWAGLWRGLGARHDHPGRRSWPERRCAACSPAPFWHQNGARTPPELQAEGVPKSLTLKNLPDGLHARLEAGLGDRPSVEDRLAQIRALRQALPSGLLTDPQIDRDKRASRP